MSPPALPLRGVIASGLRDLLRLRAVVFPVYLVNLGIARELTGKRRNRLFVYDRYLAVLNEGTEKP